MPTIYSYGACRSLHVRPGAGSDTEGDVELGDGALEGLADQVGVDGRAVVLGEHAAVVAALAGGHALFELAAAVAVPTRRRSGGPGRCCGGWWGS